MTTTDRPFLTFQTRYMELLSQAEASNAAEVLVNAADWYVLVSIAGTSKLIKSADGRSGLKLDGHLFRRKPNTKPPTGTLDLSDPDAPTFEP